MKKPPLLIAIPTTAGTGSETTLAAVITDSRTRHKYPINDFVLIPRYAVLDPEVTRGLPPAVTATTGMDALTHAVEAFIGGSTTKETRHDAISAVKLIFTYLPKAYADGNDMNARRHMLHAAYFAGNAFSKSYVGYVHAVAHSLGGRYNPPPTVLLTPYCCPTFCRLTVDTLTGNSIVWLWQSAFQTLWKAIEPVRKNSFRPYGTCRICWISPENCRKYEQRIFLPLQKSGS